MPGELGKPARKKRPVHMPPDGRIYRTLERLGWDKNEAAQELNLSPSTVYVHARFYARVNNLPWLDERRKKYAPRAQDRMPRLKTLRSLQGMGYSLDEVELKLLDLICAKGKYASAVSLAADLYDASEDIQEDRVLEWNLVELVIKDLADKGLVRYRISEPHDLVVHIRPERAAYIELNLEYPHWIRVAGMGMHHNLREAPRREDDRTDYRTHNYRAEAPLPPTKEDFIDHCADCRFESDAFHFNRHVRQLLELFGTSDV